MGSETVMISREEYELLKSQNEQLTRQIEFLTEQIRLARRQRFGSSSEQSRYDDGSEWLSFLFNEGGSLRRLRAGDHSGTRFVAGESAREKKARRFGGKTAGEH